MEKKLDIWIKNPKEGDNILLEDIEMLCKNKRCRECSEKVEKGKQPTNVVGKQTS